MLISFSQTKLISIFFALLELVFYLWNISFTGGLRLRGLPVDTVDQSCDYSQCHPYLANGLGWLNMVFCTTIVHFYENTSRLTVDCV